ncbi:hypothetical protein L873DRAFT_1787191 [Choiromyces venosus 120613-1]|uniref:Uncharacterized protein n=1 Tax=Choiromyces venosus 120613-1 TaxID=1336337 RepID=A0A3N4JXE2_9PEZI|nr:hypothetical protein L873DRAFT_1787191 [Choiromyces venosus 120613-1]
MPRSKAGLICPRTAGHENDGVIRWCKHVCRFPNLGTFSPEYRTWRNAIKCWMEREGIQSFRHSSAAQWARLQVYALTIEPIASNGRAQFWEKDTPRGRRFTECLDYLLKDVAKKHSQTVKAMMQALPPATPVPAASAAGNDCKFTKSIRS